MDKIFRAMDKNNDGRLTYEEFIGSAKQDFTIAQVSPFPYPGGMFAFLGLTL